MSIPINKSLDEIRSEIYDRINEVQDEYSGKGWLPVRLNLMKGVIRGIIEIWAWGLNQLYLLLNTILQQVFVDTATGIWLELLCRIVGVTRKEWTKAEGNVCFMRSGTSGNVLIRAGRILKTRVDGGGNVYRFVTTEDGVLAEGASEVLIPVIAEEYGALSNVAVDQICELSTPVSGVESVTNRADWLTSEGADEEKDESLRERYMLAWTGKDGCTKYAYESWALGVEGVLSVTVGDQHPRGQGTVDVLIMGTAGIPTAELISSVDSVVQWNKPINDDVKVLAPTAVNVSVEAELVLNSGTPAEIISEAENRINALFATSEVMAGVVPFIIREDVVLDKITAVLMGISGVKKVVYSSPSGDVGVGLDELATLTGVSITTSWATEI